MANSSTDSDGRTAVTWAMSMDVVGAAGVLGVTDVDAGDVEVVGGVVGVSFRVVVASVADRPVVPHAASALSSATDKTGLRSDDRIVR
jgi:hypothetical protein